MGASPDALGSLLTLDQVRLEVVGVLPPGFDGVSGGAEVWVPLSALREIENDGFLDDPWNTYFRVLARLTAGATLESARAEVQGFGATFRERFPAPVGASRLAIGAGLTPYREARANPAAEATLLALFGAVLLVLLGSTANVAGLLLARGASRRKEAAVRASLGAGKGRILRQLLTESLVLAVLGGALGVAAASTGVDVLGAWLADALGTTGGQGLEYLDPAELSVDWGVAAFATVLTAGVGLAFGLLPAWQVARTDPGASLRGGASPAFDGSLLARTTGRSGLVAVQVALALVLMSGATVMLRSLVNLRGVDRGFDGDGVLTGIYSLTRSDLLAGTDPATFHTAFLDRVRQLPGVEGATLGEVPLAGPTWRAIVMGSDGRPDLDPAMHVWVRMQPVADGHFGVLGVEVLAGREIDRTDDEGSETVIVLAETAARVLFPDGDALGRQLRLSWPELGGGATVVGIVEDVLLGEAGVPVELQAYVSVRQAPRLETGVLVRSRLDPAVLAPAVRSALAATGPETPLTSVTTLEARLAGSTARQRVVTQLLGLFGGVAVFLVAAGLYGTVAFAVTRRTRELGLRVSLGAGRSALLALLLRQGLGVTLVGIAAGLAGTLATTRFLEGLVFGTEALDLPILAGASAVLFGVGCLATWLPARRALAIDPMVALRAD